MRPGIADLKGMTDAVGYETLWFRVKEIVDELRFRKAKL